jgi:hypothetical protein
MSTTRYTKTVAAITLDGTTYYAHRSMSAVDGSPYLTMSIADARDYRPGEPIPEGYRRRRITGTVRTPDLGGGFIWECGPTGP